ncbi:ABC transporter substrate-binding protein [Acidovorax sp. NCPPB 4044]|uniref:ABC transporter substrate-binding protein n=1 Tax=Acidovorax sp. NCPPB 4044 TaxID=2940490 RepID=UPI0023027D28|nr:ABC transporter substrate-binding protein [Acidovorax sp. NCPPB 4044]MDA8522646.1 ABC transporter substrate-binding protein [Acidovorax sp. NCPPB 4044]
MPLPAAPSTPRSGPSPAAPVHPPHGRGLRALRALRALGACALAAGLAGTAQAQPAGVSVMHWWVSGGERASMDTIRDHALARGIGWTESSSPGSGTARYTDVLAARVRAGQVPSAAQMIGYEIHEWARRGLLDNLDDIAAREEWDEVVPDEIQRISKWQGHWVAAPFNAHSTNWLWVNRALAARLGATRPPDTWDDLIALLDRARAAGIAPIAVGHEAWEHTLLFESVAAGTGGAAFYRRAFVDLDPEAVTDAVATAIFERMRKLSDYLDPGFMRRRWDEATVRVARGQALMQIQGSWVDGEFRVRGLYAGVDYQCWRFPDTQGMVLFNSDQFIFFRRPAREREAQLHLASILLDRDLQTAVNLRTGAAPARVDVREAPFNTCGRQAIAELRGANMRRTLLGSIGMGNAHPSAVKVAIYDVVTRHLQRRIDTPTAVAALREAIARHR